MPDTSIVGFWYLFLLFDFVVFISVDLYATIGVTVSKLATIKVKLAVLDEAFTSGVDLEHFP